MTKIFVWCEPTGGGLGGVKDDRGYTFEPGGDVIGRAMAEDGHFFADCQHTSSSEGYSKHDMGITSDWKHDRYSAQYPDGYELIWLGMGRPPRDERLEAAIKLNTIVGETATTTSST